MVKMRSCCIVPPTGARISTRFQGVARQNQLLLQIAQRLAHVGNGRCCLLRVLLAQLPLLALDLDRSLGGAGKVDIGLGRSAAKLLLLALQARHPWQRHEALLQQLLQRPQFLDYRPELLLGGLLVGPRLVYILLRLGDLAFQHRKGAEKRAATAFELALVVDLGGLHGRIARQGIDLGREHEALELIDLGHQPGLERECDRLLLAVQLLARGAARLIEAQDDVTLFDDVAVADQDLADDAALQMLHGLAIALDRDNAGRHHRAVDAGQRRPAHQRQHRSENNAVATQQGRPIVRRRLRRTGNQDIVHALVHFVRLASLPPPEPSTTVSVGAPAARTFASRSTICARGPKACTVPAFMIRTSSQ